MNKETVTKEATKRTNGVLQECPLSVLVMNLLMCLLIKYTKEEGITQKLYLDDSIAWGEDTEALWKVKESAAEFYKKCEVVINDAKGTFFALDEERRKDMGPKFVDIGKETEEIKHLGLHYIVDCGNMTGGGTSVQAVSDQTFKRIERDMKKLKFLKNLKIKRRLLRAMVSAKVKWAATWQSLGKIEYEVTRMVEKVVAKYIFESPTLRW